MPIPLSSIGTKPGTRPEGYEQDANREDENPQRLPICLVAGLEDLPATYLKSSSRRN